MSIGHRLVDPRCPRARRQPLTDRRPKPTDLHHLRHPFACLACREFRRHSVSRITVPSPASRRAQLPHLPIIFEACHEDHAGIRLRASAATLAINCESLGHPSRCWPAWLRVAGCEDDLDGVSPGARDEVCSSSSEAVSIRRSCCGAITTSTPVRVFRRTPRHRSSLASSWLRNWPARPGTWTVAPRDKSFFPRTVLGSRVTAVISRAVAARRSALTGRGRSRASR